VDPAAGRATKALVEQLVFIQDVSPAAAR